MAKPRGQKKNYSLRYFSAIFALFCFIFSPLYARADFSLNANPVDGSSSIRFGRVDSGLVNVEVRIRINSDQKKRYELRQKLLEDFRNDEGDILGRNAVTFYTLSGTNARGSLYQDAPMQLDTFERVLYASSPQGDEDSFVIVYQINPSDINASGNFFSKILYILQPVEGGLAQQNAFLNCYLSVEKKVNFTMDTSSHSARNLRFDSRAEGMDGAVQIKSDKDLGRQFQITQLIDEPLRNEKGEIFPLEKIYFSVISQKGESLFSAPTALSQKPTQVYISGKRGEADDLVINYHINKDTTGDLSGGNFRARFTYVIESAGTVVAQLPLELQLEIAPVFEIEIPGQSNTGLLFQNIQPGVAVEKEVALSVNSNLQRPYAVIQKISSPLTNEQGNAIPSDSFKIRGENITDMPGQITIVQPTPIHLGDTTVFISDAQGRPSRFVLRYYLEGPRDVKSGDYFTKISYALVEK